MCRVVGQFHSANHHHQEVRKYDCSAMQSENKLSRLFLISHGFLLVTKGIVSRPPWICLQTPPRMSNYSKDPVSTLEGL